MTIDKGTWLVVEDLLTVVVKLLISIKGPIDPTEIHQRLMSDVFTNVVNYMTIRVHRYYTNRKRDLQLQGQ